MPKSTTPSGRLQPINNCYLEIPGYPRIVMKSLPDIGDSKSVVYNTEGIIGRASPLHTYSYSDTRKISCKFHFYVLHLTDIYQNLSDMRAICSCTYPRNGEGISPFKPPVVCKMRVGDLLANNQDICVCLENYSISYPPNVAWDAETLCPYQFDIDTSWMVVYTSSDLPYANNIITTGR